MKTLRQLLGDDLKSVLFLKKRVKKNPNYKFFVASKTGGNAKGKGSKRSVILANDDGKNWYQAVKIWGKDNEERAKEIIRQAQLQ